MNLIELNKIIGESTKEKYPNLYVEMLEKHIDKLDEWIQKTETFAKRWEELSKDWEALYKKSQQQVEEAFNDGFKQAIQQGATYDNPLGDGYITADGIDRRTGEKINEKTH